MAVRRAARSMFERFTERARRVVVLAQEEARTLDYGYIGTEHLLLGLIREGSGVAAQVLVRLGADLSRARLQVVRLLAGDQGEGEDVAGEDLPLPGDAPAYAGSLEKQLLAARARQE